ncbi:hypothetical protein [Jannaschia aquimarina]|uniref:Type IV pilus biogenesis n=1 Tax=Jannaschia aquimarina TaxID=935700 RepID=A0A0D1EIL0_9RHOB|nr:hypothetical protein [Jannaschia aquimarina]KIT17464.1 hypothetical protein jaqu_06520 [Jannaschia aquimarina]SNS75411.1 hypothetical protein SAMN05421775_102158 [Jannaschia aquimarina]
MTPRLALELSVDGIALLSRAPDGTWWREGAVTLDDPAFTTAVQKLRDRGLARVGADACSYLILPDSQLLFTTLERDDRKAEVTIRQNLTGRTPYDVDDLAFDFLQIGDRLQVAVVALETLMEAETFAAEHGFRPVAFVASPDPSNYRGVPWFGQTGLANDLLNGEAPPKPESPFVIHAAPPLPGPGLGMGLGELPQGELFGAPTPSPPAETPPEPEYVDPPAPAEDRTEQDRAPSFATRRSIPAEASPRLSRIAPRLSGVTRDPVPPRRAAVPPPVAVPAPSPDPEPPAEPDVAIDPSEPELDAAPEPREVLDPLPADMPAPVEEPEVEAAPDQAYLDPERHEESDREQVEPEPGELEADADLSTPPGETVFTPIVDLPSDDDLAGDAPELLEVEAPEAGEQADTPDPDAEPTIETLDSSDEEPADTPAPDVVSDEPADPEPHLAERTAEMSEATEEPRQDETDEGPQDDDRGAEPLRTAPPPIMATRETLPPARRRPHLTASNPAEEEPEESPIRRRISALLPTRDDEDTAAAEIAAQQDGARRGGMGLWLTLGLIAVMAAVAGGSLLLDGEEVADLPEETQLAGTPRGDAALLPGAGTAPTDRLPPPQPLVVGSVAPVAVETPSTEEAAPPRTSDVVDEPAPPDQPEAVAPADTAVAGTSDLEDAPLATPTDAPSEQPEIATIETPSEPEAPQSAEAEVIETTVPVEPLPESETTEAPGPASPTDVVQTETAVASAQTTDTPTEPELSTETASSRASSEDAPATETPAAPTADEGPAIASTDTPEEEAPNAGSALVPDVAQDDDAPVPSESESVQLVAATPEGTVAPGGYRVVAGRPSILPTPRPGGEEVVTPAALSTTEPETVPEVDPEEAARREILSRVRPQLRPDGGDLGLPDTEAAEPTETTPETEDQAATPPTIRPTPRPAGLAPETEPEPQQDAGAATDEDDPAVIAAQQAALASLAARRNRTTAETAEVETSVDDSEPVSPLALAASRRPSVRPRGVEREAAQIVTRRREAAAASPAPQQAAASTQRITPSRGGVANAATDENAIRLNRINLIGTYGRPSARRALVRLSNGRYVKVEVGDRLDRGRVVAIGDGELRYQRGGRNIVLQMPRT